MRQLLTISLFLTLLVIPAHAEKVCSVHDGDTLRLCNGQRIRVWGVDAPELKQPYGYQSRDYLRQRILDRDVSLDCTGKGRSHKRKVCTVFHNGLDMAKEMVGWGYAFREPNFDKEGVYESAERFAEKEKRGVWESSQPPEVPWIYRKEIHNNKS